jgi:acetolactate decarboxylase
VATIDALMAGQYDGVTPLPDLLRHGDLGIGTFETLDGELILLDGVVFQARVDGRVSRPDPRGRIPFAIATWFDADTPFGPAAVTSLKDLCEKLDARSGPANQPVAVRLEGRFSRVRFRSVPPQKPPYPPLTEAARGQQVHDRSEIAGTVVGFRYPAFMEGLNVPGWHLHFITADRTQGGHLLDLSGLEVRGSIDPSPFINIETPRAGPFHQLRSHRAENEALRRIESDPRR